MQKITHATDEQWQQIEACRLRWLHEEQTAQYPVETIQRTVLDIFALMKQSPPSAVIVVDSPLVARLLSGLLADISDSNLPRNLRTRLHSSLFSSLYTSLHTSLRTSLYASLHDSLCTSLHASLHDSLCTSLHGSLRTSLHSGLHSSLHNSLHDSLHTSLHDSLYTSLYTSLQTSLQTSLYASLHDSLYDSLRTSLHSYVGGWWNALAGWCEGCDILGVPRVPEYELFMAYSRHCPVWMWDNHFVYILRRPRSISWCDDELHCDDGPSVDYADHFRLWHIRGVQVDEQIVMQPGTQSLPQIDGERNAETKRIRIERYGWEKYLRAKRAKVLEHRRNDIEGTDESLMRCDDMTVLVCACPSTVRTYALEVDPSCSTVEQAQAYLGGGRVRRLVGAS